MAIMASDGWGTINYDFQPNVKIKEFVEFVLQIIGVDLTYEEFEKMTDDDKKKFLRNIKINKILNESK